MLHPLSTGTAGPRVAFLHGLFGQGRNWMQVAKALAGEDGQSARALLLDLPDHGRSPWSPPNSGFSYKYYVDAVAETLQAASGGDPWTVVGHSLGGKVAMLLALTHPQLVERLAVVDIAPRSYGNLHRFASYIEGMQQLPLDDISTRAEADERFAEVECDPGVRGFLLQNLRRDGQDWRWQANLDLIAADAARGEDSQIAAFPVPAGWSPYAGPVVWIVGAESGYVDESDDETMRELFPSVRKVTVKGASHWVHTDAPEVTIEILRALLNVEPAAG